MVGSKERGNRFLSAVSQKQGNGHKLKYRKFYLNDKKKLRRDQTLEQVAQKGCAVFTLGNIQTEIDMTLSNLL